MSPHITAQYSNDGHKANPQPFNFMGLPTEVRLMVYELALVADDRPLLRSRDEMIPTYKRGTLAKSEEAPTIKDPSAPKLFNFKGLPPRLRAQISADCYAAGSRTILTSRDEMLGPPERSYADRLDHFKWGGKLKLPLADTGLLRLSRKVLDEAASVFYGKNRFHYSISVSDDHHNLLPFSRNPSFLRQLPLMKHISLDLGDCIDNFWRKHYTKIAERILPAYLATIEQCCIKDRSKTLKTLDLSLMSLPADDTYLYSAPEDSFNDLLANPGPTSQALRRMKHNIGAIKIVAIGSSGPENVLAGVCSQIAPENEWQKGTWSAWEGKKLDVVPVRRLPEIVPYLQSDNEKPGLLEDAVHCWRFGSTDYS